MAAGAGRHGDARRRAARGAPGGRAARAGPGGRAGDLRPLPRARAEPRRRLRPRARHRLDADAHGLGRDRPGRRRAAIRATSTTTCSPTSARTPTRCAATSASARAPSSPCAPPARARSRPAGATSSRRSRSAQEGDGSWPAGVNTTAFAVLALRAAGRRAGSAPVRAGVEFIAGQANDDGGFNFAGTRAAVGRRRHERRAAGARRRRPAPFRRRAARGRAGSSRVQNADGGFSLQWRDRATPSRPRGRCRG